MPHSIAFVLNSATPRSAIAIFRDDQLAAARLWGDPRRTGSLLKTSLQEMLLELKLELSAVETVICAHGPGSFTGLRVGLSLLKGIFFDQQVNYAGVNTLDALARGINSREAEIYPCVFYRKDAVFSAGYRKQDSVVQRFREPFVLTSLDLQELPAGAYFTGAIEAVFPATETRLETSRFNLLSPHDRQLSLDWLYSLGQEEIARHGGRALNTAEPYYQVDFKPTPPGKGISP
ncbi:MAG: tRNA (adenosine(37)-N6)-threonylcarbamoyltransferase complex dimerization subunit type 1 TsaB [Candidatus Delongbacteria bacterium]|nr:tRNA (adenosine(37)-N6)-threonylcarbamoyltransferase complex dimerization subunit type 1 TsaB [bacterium]MBL7032952.1 tRNA (adenosine(37)-N6)-threonylcarbamoyltransferase complex dimerization subunit type 1 TsaB [Candidatus Delongbacteria bacterium]